MSSLETSKDRTEDAVGRTTARIGGSCEEFELVRASSKESVRNNKRRAVSWG